MHNCIMGYQRCICVHVLTIVVHISYPYSCHQTLFTRRKPGRLSNGRGATTAEKLRGPRFRSQHRGACAGLGVGCWRGSPPPAV